MKKKAVVEEPDVPGATATEAELKIYAIRAAAFDRYDQYRKKLLAVKELIIGCMDQSLQQSCRAGNNDTPGKVWDWTINLNANNSSRVYQHTYLENAFNALRLESGMLVKDLKGKIDFLAINVLEE